MQQLNDNRGHIPDPSVSIQMSEIIPLCVQMKSNHDRDVMQRNQKIVEAENRKQAMTALFEDELAAGPGEGERGTDESRHRSLQGAEMGVPPRGHGTRASERHGWPSGRE